MLIAVILRRVDTQAHQCSCGHDLQARSMSRGVVSHDGDIVRHRPMNAAPAAFRTAVAPSREGLVVGGACLFTWSGLAALWAAPGLPCVLGHARSMPAIHGGQAKHATIASHKLAALLRGGLLPPASVSPAALRARRERRRGGVLERLGVSRPQSPEPGRLLGHPRGLRHRRRLLAPGARGRPLPRTGHELARPTRSASLLTRTVGGHREVSRSHRTTADPVPSPPHRR
jgi:hypothetical protein